ncbi:BTAD domain-containing putative transcriptional regulator [Rhizobium mayense]|uniref:BTAD domain-containing putative transcriptional regulator n=1 Tax=Rhizobium mayense TaxID=1312184 RepID=A0ABT7JY68_9HYPH|nr:BTAD domain-containing putative transcriptional regulator [Rhizobium mayense]MDL2401296.1 BTAD domain-containing putative transcriptional regulator [Rhizobium mayense]
MGGEYSGGATKISLFGGFRIESESAGPLRLTGRRGPAIVAYLASCPGMAATRERLADLLWYDSDSEHSRNSLRQTLSILRQDLSRAGVDLVHFGRESIDLKPNAARVDVEEFEAGLSARSAQDLEKALANYTGPFLEGLCLGGKGFDDWVALERDRLLNRALESFEKLARLVDEETGLSLADRLLAMEPTREASYRLKIELLIACGQRDRAMRVYETCRNVLKKEFGVDVSPETRVFWQSLQSQPDNMPNLQPPNGVSVDQRSAHPSICVSDFVNLTGKPGDDFFARGLVQDITTALSEVADYVVVSGPSPAENNSSGEEGKLSGMPRARYTLSGSIQRSGEALRVNVQLVDAVDGRTVWAQKFDGGAEDTLEFQDGIAQSVVLAVSLELQFTNWKVRDKSPPGPPEVRRLVNEALMNYFEMTRPSLLSGIEIAEKALSLSPNNARAKRTLSVLISMAAAFGALPREGHIEHALELAEEAVSAVPDDEIARVILSFALEGSGRIDEAIAECQHAIRLNPNYPSSHGDISGLLALRGQVSEAVREANEAIRLGTHDVIDFWRHHSLVVALFAGGDDQRALEVARRVVRTKPGFVRGALYWAAAASATGNNDEASRAIHHCLSQLPHLNLSNVCPGFVPRYVSDHLHSRFLEMLSRAGLPGV